MKIFRFLGNEFVLGTLIALLSVFTAVASYQGAMADSEQNKFEILGMQNLNDGNAEYLTANQEIIQDYTYFDNWYLNLEERPEIADYYQLNFSQALIDAMDRNPDVVFDDQYYDEMYSLPNEYFDDSDVNFGLGAQWDERGDQLQLVMLLMALGLAFAAWGSLLKDESMLRLVFSGLAVITLIVGLVTYFQVPAVG